MFIRFYGIVCEHNFEEIINVLDMADEIFSNTFKRWNDFLVYEKRFSPHTVTAYLSDLKATISFITGYEEKPMTLGLFSEVPLQTWRALLTQRLRDGVTHRSNKRLLASVRHFNNFLAKGGFAQNEALHKITSPKVAPSLPRPLPAHKMDAFLNIKLHKEPWLNARDTALFTLLYGAGLRIGEALGLKGNVIPVENSIKVLGKGGKERVVPLLPVVIEVLRRYLELCPYVIEDDTCFFYSTTGKPLYPQAASKVIRQLRAALDLPESVTPHALRHSFASHVLQNTSNLRAIQKMMGHKSLNSTQVYLDVEDDALRQQIQVLHPRQKKT